MNTSIQFSKTQLGPILPCFYVSAISKTDQDSAPKNSENLFVLVPVAPGLDDTDEIREHYYNKVLDHIESITGESIREHIEVSRIYSHRDFSADYNAYDGTALGIAHTLGQTAFFRPSHRSKKVKNLFYTGQYTHPGVGVPMTLVASSVASNIIKEING
jgi:phytoene dehydrogenase-like protein